MDTPGRCIAGNDVFDIIRGVVGIDDTHYWNPELGRFQYGDFFVTDIDNKQDIGQSAHFLDSAQGLLKLFLLARQIQDFLFADLFIIVAGRHVLKLLETLDRGAHGTEVGQHAAQPAMVDEWHTAAQGFFLDRLAGGALGADKHDFAFLRCNLAEIVNRVAAQGHGLLEIDDVNLVALAENKGSHFGIPETGLVPKMHARF